MPLLVSFCAPGRPGLLYALLDWRTRHIRWLDTRALPDDARGMGLCVSEDALRALYVRGPDPGAVSGLVEFDRSLQPRCRHEFAMVKQAHSIVRCGGSFLINSTGTDSLVQVHPNPQGGYSEEVVWCVESDEPMHVNSVLRLEGRVLVTMFGPKENGGWSDTARGAVWDTGANQVLCDGLSHPHTLFDLDGRVCFLESFRGRVLAVGAEGAVELFRVPGYTRGAALDGDVLYVGTSKVRFRSKHTGEQRQRVKIHSYCAIYRIDTGSGNMTSWDLRTEGREIYDLAIWP